MAIQYQCDTFRDITYRNFGSIAGPVNMASVHINLPHWPAMAIQYQCDTFRDIPF